jgi:hypothetical protein
MNHGPQSSLASIAPLSGDLGMERRHDRPVATSDTQYAFSLRDHTNRSKSDVTSSGTIGWREENTITFPVASIYGALLGAHHACRSPLGRVNAFAIEDVDVVEEAFIRTAGRASPIAFEIRGRRLKHDEPSVRGDLRPRAAAIAALCQHRRNE